MSNASVTIKGDAELRRSLKRAGSDVEQMTAAHTRVAQLVASAARPPRRTGALSGSIRPAARPAAAEVGSDLPYAGMVEYGTRRMRAQPYLRPAFEQTQPLWADIYSAELQTICDRVEGA